MLQLLQPIWLLAATGIIIPVVIHLWNIKQGKTLKVGSIALLTRTAQEHATSLRLTELFLLLLRCLLIVLLSLLLAKPYWQTNQRRHGWILMEQKDVEQGYAHFKPLIDSLVNAGYEFHLFSEGFEKKDLSAVLKEKADTVVTYNTSYWKLIKQLDISLPADLPVYAITNNQLKRFTGDRPQLSIALNWKTFTPQDSTRTVIARAYTAMADSIVMNMRETSPSRTVFYPKAIAVNRPKQQEFNLSVTDGNVSVIYQNQPPVLIDTNTLFITVFAEKYLTDALYVQAAIRAVQQVSRRKIKLVSVSDPRRIPANQDWLFWLSDQLITAGATNVLMYEKGNTETIQSWVNTVDMSTPAIELLKRIPYQKKEAINIWNDGFGIPILTKEEKQQRAVYRLYTHLNPSWNGLAWSPSFPQLIYGLIDSGVIQNKIDSADQRAIDETQAQVDVSNRSAKKTLIAETDSSSAKRILWMLISIVFFMERFFSFKGKKERTDA